MTTKTNKENKTKVQVQTNWIRAFRFMLFDTAIDQNNKTTNKISTKHFHGHDCLHLNDNLTKQKGREIKIREIVRGCVQKKLMKLQWNEVANRFEVGGYWNIKIRRPGVKERKCSFTSVTKDLFNERWGIPVRWGNPLIWGNPLVNTTSHFNLITFIW